MEVQMFSSSLGAMGSLLGKLGSLLVSPGDQLPDTLKPQKEKLQILKQDLEEMNTMLGNLSRVQAPNTMGKLWMNEVRDLSYDIEDYIDKTMSPSNTGEKNQEIPFEIEEFVTLVKHARDRYSRYDLGRWASSPAMPMVADGQVRLPTLSGQAITDLVGINDATTKLIKLLSNDAEQGMKVVSVLGPAGVGKSTLAKQVYRKMGGKFDCRAFVRASRMPDTRRLLRSIISQVQRHQRPPHGLPVQELIDNLRELLQQKRYFILIDGLWETTSWDIVYSAFPEGTHCSRILITTDIEEVALECCDYESDGIFMMEPLSRTDSIELLFNRTLGSKHQCSEQVKEVSEEIIKKCGGLPLAVICIASILAGQPDNSELWQHVSEWLSGSMRNNRTSQDMLREIVGLSYNNLPDYLKTCLLYLSMYPEGYTFLKTDLVKQWSAEGFISAIEGNDTSEVAEFNFDELVCTGLIQPNCIDFSEEVTFYTVHSTVFEVIRCKSMEENFTTVIDYSEVITKLSAKVRRVSLTFSSAKYATKPEGITLSEVRSLIFYGLAKCLPSIMELKLLRVLILEFWGDKKELDISGINKLFQLRYLRITTDMTVKLPARMQELLYLETIETYARVTTFPSDAFDLPRLMHLCLQDVINLPDGIGQMRSLRTLQFFDLSRNSYDNVRSLEELTNLRDLHLTCCSTSSSLEHHIMRNLIALVSSLEKLGNLKTMVLAPAASCTSINLCYSGNMSSLPVFLQRLELLPPICIFSRIPIWMGQLQKLCSLKIALSELSSGDVDNIARLPELTILSLYVRQPTAESIIFNRASFPVLKCLKFRCGVMRLTFLAGTMPNLRRLKLEFNAHSGEQYGDMLVGIEHLLNLQEIIGRIGAAPGAEESDRMAAESMFKDATISKHSRLTSFNLQRVNSFGEEISRCADTPWSHSGSVDSRFSGVFDLPSAYQPSCHLKSDENSKHHVLVSILRDESAKPSTLDLSLLENITNNFSSEKEIDQGGFGMVYKGILGDVIVAVKRLYGQHGNVDGKFARVIDCLMTVKHSNIVRFLGYCVHTQPKGIKDGMKTFCVEQQEMLLCFEYLHNGSLQRYITEESCGLEWHTRYQIIKGICQGLGYLHENSIIHLDLKPENILLDANMVPKIADYAYARLLSEDSRTAPENFTTSLSCRDYMAPEYYEDGVFSFKSDIYSLGIIIMQIVTGQKDHGNIMSVLGGWRSRLESDTSRTHTALETAYHQVTLCIVMGQNCMHRDPRKRPVLWDILDRLGEMGTSEESVTRGISLVPEFKNHSVPKSSNKEVFQWPSEKVKASLTSLLTSGKDNINKHQQAKTSSEITEEVAKAYTSFVSRAPSLCRTLAHQNQPPRYKLTFMNGLGSAIYIKRAICDTNGKPLKICVIANGQDEIDRLILCAKIRVVVLDGDFNRHNQECWTWEEFNNYIVRPRDKVGAILAGDLEMSLTNGEAYLHSAHFIDHSRFMRNGKFRLGVMVIDNLGERVQEGITEPFFVKDRRGDGYKKSVIPSLNDAVWRLEKISKNGPFHKALIGSGILFVKDFLRLYYKDKQALRKILNNASEFFWTTIVEHAKKCDPGRELYSFLIEGHSVLLFFNSVYQIVGAKFGDNYLPFNDLEKAAKELVIQWSKVAYENITFKEPDYEMDDGGKPRPINQGTSMLEHKFTDLVQDDIDRNVCQADNLKGTSCSHSKQSTFKRLGSIRLMQNDEDESFDYSDVESL